MIAPAAMIVLGSILFASAGVFAEEQDSALADMARGGNGHWGNRVNRLPWVVHRFGPFISLTVLFWVISEVRKR